MHWYNAHSLHVYAPSRVPYGKNWVEQLLGGVIRPLLSDYDGSISWLWVTRYAGPYDEVKPPQGVPLPDDFRGGGFYRYIVLRLHAAPEPRDAIHLAAIRLAQQAGCFIEPRGWFPYDPVEDLGGDRFIRNNAAPQDRNERARLVALFVDATVRLMLHSLSRDGNGNWTLEPNAIQDQNPQGSFFQSVHHLFCNATGVPTTVLAGGEWTSLTLATRWMAEPVVIAGEPSREFQAEALVHY